MAESRMGAPEKIDQNNLVSLMRMKPSLEDCATFFKCSSSAIEKYIRRHYDQTYSEFRETNMVGTRFRLINQAIALAESGNEKMLIFCLKNICSWKDKVEHSGETERPIQLAYEVSPKRQG